MANSVIIKKGLIDNKYPYEFGYVKPLNWFQRLKWWWFFTKNRLLRRPVIGHGEFKPQGIQVEMFYSEESMKPYE